jgi:hypothetical protein
LPTVLDGQFGPVVCGPQSGGVRRRRANDLLLKN